MKKIFFISFVFFASKIGHSSPTNSFVLEGAGCLVVGCSGSSGPRAQELFDKAQKEQSGYVSESQNFSDLESFKKNASQVIRDHSLLSKIRTDGQGYELKEAIELRGNFLKIESGENIYQHSDNSIFMDKQSKSKALKDSSPLANLFFGSPETSEEIKKHLIKKYGRKYVGEVFLNDMCFLTPDRNNCDGGKNADWNNLFKSAAALLPPGGVLKISPCTSGTGINLLIYEVLLEDLGFDTSSIQREKIVFSGRYESLFRGHQKEVVCVSYVLQPKHLITIRKKKDVISSWIYSNLPMIVFQKPKYFFHLLISESPKAKNFRELIREVDDESLKNFVGHYLPRRENFLEFFCDFFEKTRESNELAPLQDKIFKVLFSLIGWEWADSTFNKEILDKLFEIGFEEKMSNLIKEKYKDRSVSLLDPPKKLVKIFKHTNVTIEILDELLSRL